MASLERVNLVVFYYLSACEICSDKTGGLWCDWPNKRRGGATVVDYPYLPVFLDHQYFYLLLSFHLEVLTVL